MNKNVIPSWDVIILTSESRDECLAKKHVMYSTEIADKEAVLYVLQESCLLHPDSSKINIRQINKMVNLILFFHHKFILCPSGPTWKPLLLLHLTA